jgi:hypothetical protein
MGTTRLYSTVSLEEQWSAVTGPWLRAHAGTAWKRAQPTVILTPSRAESFYLRARLVAEGVPFLGLRFWTPSDARKFLLGELLPGVGNATQTELRLLARVCAERLAQESVTADAILTSVVREPDAFLRAYDLLLGAGWNPAREGAVYGRDLAHRFQRELDDRQIATQAGLHRRLLRETASQKKALLAHLLVIGFNAAHWPLWDLLQAMVHSSEQTLIALSNPRTFGESVDQLWTSSWEEVTGSEVGSVIDPAGSSETEAPFLPLIASYEKGVPASEAPSGLTLLATSDLATQIRAVVLQALDYLQHDSCTRLGIVFPEANALALGVAEELQRLGLPLDDGIGALAPGIFEQRCWQSWIALQEEPGVERLIAWLRACEAQGLSCGVEPALAAREMAGVIDSALGESLVDDLGFLARHLEEDVRWTRSGIVADFLRERVALPETATFPEFLAFTRQALTLPGWQDYLAQVELDPPQWLREADWILPRRMFLEWLKDATESQTRIRSAESNHFYGRVHLLVYAQMGGQTWSHLILTGLNEGVWPRVFEAGAFGSRHELAKLNQQARTLNKRSIAQGGQGEGHEAVQANHGHCLLPLEKQDLALRDLCAALEGTAKAVCLTAMTSAAGRGLLPSDFFNQAYQARTGHVLDEEAFRRLAVATEEWIERQKPSLAAHDKRRPAERRLSAGLTVMRTAYAARREGTRQFGPYEFAFAQPPPRPIQLSCKRWEDAWNHPATVWLEDVVGAGSWAEGTLSWPRAVGTWVHKWLTTALRETKERQAPAEFPVLLWAAADREAEAIRQRAQASGIELYPWWEQVWAQARAAAMGLGETLVPHLSGRQFLSEIKLPGKAIALPGTDRPDFTLKGRIDLVLFEPGQASFHAEQGDFTGCTCWVIDFKTGSAPVLTVKKIAEGKGIQPLLYALAIHDGGALSTVFSLHTPDAPLKQQVQLEAVLENTGLFRSLDKLHREGIFGMRPDADNAYGYSPAYPMATRFIPGSVLEAKWALVHGSGLSAAEEGE